jgi:hypothetical protein
VYLLCIVIDEGQLVNAAVVVTYVLILLVGYLQQLVRDFLVLCCMHVVMYLSVDRVLTFLIAVLRLFRSRGVYLVLLQINVLY